MKFSDFDGESATCPKCSESWADLWDYNWTTSDEEKIQCPHCDTQLTLRRNIEVTYAIASGWDCWKCEGRGNTYFFKELCANRQCNHSLGDKPISCPVQKSVCEACEGSGLEKEEKSKEVQT
jgi:hypothetical protein